MDRNISPLTGLTAAISSPPPQTIKKDQEGLSFEQTLKEKSDVLPKPSQAYPHAKGMLVGEISPERQTVSELLMQNSALKKSTWNILRAPQNREKNYTALPIGTRVYFNPEQKTLSWSAPAPPQHKAMAQQVRLPQHQIFEPSIITGQSAAREQSPGSLVQLGQISDKLPTISHLLKAEPTLREEAWNILSNPANRQKDFTALQPGTQVLFDPVRKEISWSNPGKTVENGATGMERIAITGTPVPIPVGNTGGPERQVTQVSSDKAVYLGRIDQNNPTVSHLLTKNPEYRDRIWDLLSKSVNQQKDFHQIGSGTQIYLDPQSMEISWNNYDGSQPSKAAQAGRADESIPTIAASSKKKILLKENSFQNVPAADLTEAVQPFLGTSYKDIDCYELLVKGLDRMDIPYNGKDGLFSKLRQMALEKGLPANAYLNGEGIVRAAGSLILSKNFPSSSNSNWQKDSAALYKEMEPLLDKGQILSFSTRRRGHTGIISQQDEQWTFINSGRLDNSLTSNSVSKGVGEEDLHKELRNWFKLAHKSKETLTVTLGQLEQQKVATAYNVKESIAHIAKRI